MKTVTFSWNDGYGLDIKVSIFGYAGPDGTKLAALDMSWYENGEQISSPEAFVDAEELYDLAAVAKEAADRLTAEGDE